MYTSALSCLTIAFLIWVFKRVLTNENEKMYFQSELSFAYSFAPKSNCFIMIQFSAVTPVPCCFFQVGAVVVGFDRYFNYYKIQ
jgi:hypothetical protein